MAKKYTHKNKTHAINYDIFLLTFGFRFYQNKFNINANIYFVDGEWLVNDFVQCLT